MDNKNLDYVLPVERDDVQHVNIKRKNIKIKRIAPMGDPISVELRGYVLCVSKKDLSQIIVRVWGDFIWKLH